MNGNKILADTNIVLYLLSGRKIDYLFNKQIVVSFITELELLSYPSLTPAEEQTIINFLQKVKIIDIDAKIKQKTIELGRKYKFKLPDAIICATALAYNLPLITNDRQLQKMEEVEIVKWN